MKDWLIYCIGFIAQILFSSRLIIQWANSEKAGKVVTPTLFWTLSLTGSFLLFIYGYLRLDFAIMLGQSLTYFIYIRNIQIQRKWKKLPLFMRFLLYTAPIFIVLFYLNNNNKIDVELLFQNSEIPLWLLILGIIAQVIFTFRFIYQWIYSEKHNESVLPMGFWVLSFIGALLILTYAIIRKDPVLFIGHIFGLVIYARNGYLIRRNDD